MKKLFFIAVAIFSTTTFNSCRKETIIERVEVQKGNLIYSGMGAPDPKLGNIGDYYLDVATSELYGSKTAQGWGTPLSLRGPQGPAGTPGIQGTPGANGTNGTNGVTPHIGSNGNWFIGSTDTGIKAQGPQGAQGTPGANGTNGTNGVTPHIGNNGNWFIGSTDTGIKAQGPQGATGAQGVSGKDGTKIYAGQGAPSDSKGYEGDWYIDTQNKRLYGPKGATNWSNSYISLGVESSLTSPQPKPISSNLYKLSADGKVLEKWYNYDGQNVNADMAADPVLSKITRIKSRAFYERSIRMVTIPNGVTVIESLAFFRNSLSSIVIPPSVKVIESAAFMSNDLTRLVIPSTVERIGDEAFRNNNFHTIIFERETPPQMDDIFVANYTTTNIYVPARSVDIYKKAMPRYAHRIKPKP